MENNGGGLSFTSEMDNDKLDATIAETLRRVQGFSDAVVDSGKVFDSTSQQMLDDARNMLQQIGAACDTHEQELAQLGDKYDLLGKQIADAYMQGRDKEMLALKEQQNAVQGEMKVRQRLLAQLREQSNALEEEASKLEKAKAEADNAGNAHESLRSKIRALKEQMADMVANGVDQQSAAYKELVNELGRLQDIQGDIQTQGSVLANDNAQFAGILSGLQGVVGGFTAAQGAVALFAGENENLQKIMLKVQSLMSITMGLQQAAAALNKDSAFSLVTLTSAKEWWNNLLDVGRGKQIAETEATIADTTAQVAHATAQATDAAATTADTAATEANTVAQGQNTAATGANAVAQGVQSASAVAGTAANIGLAGAFRMVGAAIKSIPVFGWIVAGISAVIALVSHFVSKAQAAKKAQEDWYKSVADNVYKPVAAITDLQTRWNALGDDFEAKKKFVENNKKAFDDLGLSVKGVTDAENILSSPAQVKKFVDAQIKKAEAMIYMQQATEKVKTLMENRQKEKNMSDTTSKWVQTSQFGTGYFVEVENTAKKELKAANDALEKEIRDGFTNASKAEQDGMNILKNAGIEATKTYADGSLGAIEEAIRLKQEALKNLTNNADYKKGLEEIKKLQAQADAITGKKSGGGSGGKGGSKGGGGSTKDPFLEKLSKYKAEYQRFNKWVNSGDKILIQSANKEFAGLLQQGATYIDYLKNQRDIILSVDVANRTKAQNKQLRQLNDAISEETKKTVLEAFNNELSDQLTNAKTVLEMLKVIEAKRNELANDGTELDDGKKEALDNAEKQAKEQLQQQTEQLLDEYSSYVAKKRKLEEQFNADVAVLNKRRAEATSDAERDEIDAAIANRKKKYEKDSQGSGNADYDKLLEEYGSFEQKKQAIIDDFEEKRKTATEMGNQELADKLVEAQAKALSKLASEELTGSDMWAQLFGNLDELTATQIDTLIQEIEAKFNDLSGIFNPIDLNNIRQKLEEAKGVLMQDNPFKQLGEAIKAVFNENAEDSKDSAEKIKKNWKKLGEATKSSFEFVEDAVNSCAVLKDLIGDVGSTAISSMAACASAAVAVATAIKSAEKASVILAIIQAALVVVQAVASFVSSIFGNKDKKIEKQIGKWKDAVNDLKNAYTQLAWEIDKTLGSTVYKSQKTAIKNMEAQKAYLQQMWRAEESKKKTDGDKVREYKEQYAELTRQISDMYDEIANDILQTDAKEFATSLGGALVEAFEKGTDASKAFEQTVNEVLKNAIVNQLKKRFLEEQLQGALNNLTNNMGYWNGDDFVFDGLTDTEIAQFKAKVQAAANNFNSALGVYKDLFKELTDDADSSLTGSVKGVTEETASLVAGQMNAMRINQLEATAVLRQSLQALNTIAMNTQYNKYLTKIDRVITLLERSTSDSSLRSQGLS